MYADTQGDEDVSAVLSAVLSSRNYEKEWKYMPSGPQHFRGGLVWCFLKIHSTTAVLNTTHLPLHAEGSKT